MLGTNFASVFAIIWLDLGSVLCHKLLHLYLLWNHRTKLNQTWQGWSLDGSLSKLYPREFCVQFSTEYPHWVFTVAVQFSEENPYWLVGYLVFVKNLLCSLVVFYFQQSFTAFSVIFFSQVLHYRYHYRYILHLRMN